MLQLGERQLSVAFTVEQVVRSPESSIDPGILSLSLLLCPFCALIFFGREFILQGHSRINQFQTAEDA